MTDDTRTDTEATVAPKGGDTIYLMTAVPRKTPKAPPVFPNPAHRPEGNLAPLILNIIREVPRGVDIALGRAPQRNAAEFVPLPAAPPPRQTFLQRDRLFRRMLQAGAARLRPSRPA